MEEEESDEEEEEEEEEDNDDEQEPSWGRRNGPLSRQQVDDALREITAIRQPSEEQLAATRTVLVECCSSNLAALISSFLEAARTIAAIDKRTEEFHPEFVSSIPVRSSGSDPQSEHHVRLKNLSIHMTAREACYSAFEQWLVCTEVRNPRGPRDDVLAAMIRDESHMSHTLRNMDATKQETLLVLFRMLGGEGDFGAQLSPATRAVFERVKCGKVRLAAHSFDQYRNWTN